MSSKAREIKSPNVTVRVFYRKMRWYLSNQPTSKRYRRLEKARKHFYLENKSREQVFTHGFFLPLKITFFFSKTQQNHVKNRISGLMSHAQILVGTLFGLRFETFFFTWKHIVALLA